jgi:hypothetical protein
MHQPSQAVGSSWDEGPEDQLDDFFQQVKPILEAWDDCPRFLI